MKKPLFLSVSILLIVGTLIRCGSNSASNLLTSATTGVKNAPDVNPSSLDAAAASSITANVTNAVNFTPIQQSDARATLQLEFVSTPVANGVDFTMKQCAGASQSHYVNIVATNDDGKIKYVKTETSKSSFPSASEMNITSTVYTDANGVPNGSRASTIRSNSPYDFYASFSSDGTTNKFAATNGTSHVIGAWNSTLGCAKIGSSGTNVPFALSISSTGARTCSASTDETLCSSLPTMETTVPAFANFTGSQIFTNGGSECAAASSCTSVTPASAIGLEDAGGTYCASLSGTKAHWATASTTVDCSTSTTAAGVCACLWPFYASSSTKIKSSARSGECKIKGIINNGDFDAGTDLATTKNVCIRNLSIAR